MLKTDAIQERRDAYQPATVPPTPKVHGKTSSCTDCMLARFRGIWTAFLSIFDCNKGVKSIKEITVTPQKSLSEKIQSMLDLIDVKEDSYKQLLSFNLADHADYQAHCREAQKTWHFAIKNAFTETIKGIMVARINPCQIPRKEALLMTEILWRYGRVLYANDSAPHPFQASLDVLKAAIVMQNYALRLSDSHPDLSKVHALDELHAIDQVRQRFVVQAEHIIDKMDASAWARKAVELDQRHFLYVPEILRFTNGAMRYLEQTDMQRSRLLLETAEACLAQGKSNPNFDQKALDNQMAELIYNDLTGYTATCAKNYEDKQEFAEAQKLWDKLEEMWTKCVALSAEPEKMQARCNNKRTFVKKLSVEEDVALRKLAVDAHLALPRESRDVLLLALAWNNLSHAQEQAGDFASALHSSKEALALTIECRARGDQNTQLAGVISHAKYMVAKYSQKFAVTGVVV